jgi:hypothetical protein
MIYLIHVQDLAFMNKYIKIQKKSTEEFNLEYNHKW